MKLSRLRVVRRHGDAIEAISDDGMGPRVTAWPGSAPPRPPKHRSLTRPIDRRGLLLAEGPHWLELRPPGALLSELDELAEGDLALLLLDLAEALTALHKAGQAHGAVDPEHVVIAPGGKAVLIGIGQREGDSERDAHDLRMLMASLWPADAKAPPPDPGVEPAAVIAESIAGWLEFEYPGHSAFHIGSKSLAVCPALPAEAETLDEPGSVDEVGVNLGSDAQGGGLLDPWTTGHSTSTRTRTREGTGEPQEVSEAQRTALLGRLMSPSERAPDPQRFEGREAEAAGALRSLLAEEPLDAVHTPSAMSPPDLVDDMGFTENPDEGAPPGLEEEALSPVDGEAGVPVWAPLLVLALVGLAWWLFGA